MPASNGFTVGRDVSLDLYTSRGPLPLPPTVTSFDSKQATKSIDSVGLDGTNRFAELPAGWDGSIGIDRSDDTIDAFFAQMEDDYYAGVVVPLGTITETIEESNGSISQYRYTGVVFKFDNAGNKSGDNKVAQTLSWKASRRLKVL